jgi:hypothetical protein
MATTIQISKDLQQELVERKLFDSESYEEVIWDMMEDISELSEETKKAIRASETEIKEGKTVSLEEVKKNLGM